jgi:hypothetical protein
LQCHVKSAEVSAKSAANADSTVNPRKSPLTRALPRLLG